MSQTDVDYERELTAEMRLLKTNIEYFKRRFDREHMKNLSIEWKRFKLPEWERLNETLEPLAHRLTLIEQYQERTSGGQLLELGE